MFHGGRRKKPAFTVSCNAKAIIHGNMGPDSDKKATLLAYEFKFNSYRGARLKHADILFEFHAASGQAGGPSVLLVRPQGLYKMETTKEDQSSKRGIELSGGPKLPVADIGLKLSGEEEVAKAQEYHTVVTGDNPQSDMWGNYYAARFSLSENQSQKSGIPSKLVACILLERDDDKDFTCVPYIKVTPDFKSTVASLLSFRQPDDPVLFSVDEPALNKLDGEVDIDEDNLGGTDVDSIWDCTSFINYTRSVKQS